MLSLLWLCAKILAAIYLTAVAVVALAVALVCVGERKSW